MPNTNDIKRFHTLLGKLNLRDQKATMLEAYEVESTKDLTNGQIKELCNRLQQMLEGKTEASEAVRRARSHVLYCLADLGIQSGGKDYWNRVNAYLLQPRISGRYLYELNLVELKQLARKLKAILRKQNEQVEASGFMPEYN